MLMANNRWSLPEGDVHASNHGQHPHASNRPIACRLCNQVFLSNEDLINHIDSHIEHGEIALRRGYQPRHITSERGTLPNRFPPNIPMPMQEARNFPDNRIFSPSQQPAVMHPTRRNTFPGASRVVALPPMHHIQSPLARNNAMIANLPCSRLHQLKMEESSIDGTMPYIKLLEKPIKSIEVINLVDEEDENPDLQALDLSLAL